MLQAIGIAAVAAAGAGATYWVVGPPSRVLHCDPATLKPDEICLADVGSQVVWVDARPRSDWERDGLPGSMLWNLDPNEDVASFEAEAVARMVETPRVVVYCSDESCGVSRQVAAKIRGLDLGGEVLVLHGGWRALREAGMVKDSSPTP